MNRTRREQAFENDDLAETLSRPIGLHQRKNRPHRHGVIPGQCDFRPIVRRELLRFAAATKS
jgi:hypothetical protein